MKRRREMPHATIQSGCDKAGERARTIRLMLGMSQEGIADRLADVGVVPRRARAVIAKLESGRRPMQLAEAVGYARLAGITVEDLVSPEPVEFRTIV